MGVNKTINHEKRSETRRAYQVDFCPNCEMKLIPLKKIEGQKVTLLLTCRKCDYEKKASRSTTIFQKTPVHPPQECIVVIGKKEQKLRTLPTIRMECPRCGNNLAYVWMVQVRKCEESSTQFLRCTKCNYTFRENS